MLKTATIVAFVASAQPDLSREFYRDTLGLTLVSEDSFAIVFECGGVPLRIQKVQTLQPHPFTALGWSVPDIRGAVSGLSARGVVFERYGFLEQDDSGIWRSPAGARIAWFKDPDGNLLSVVQFE